MALRMVFEPIRIGAVEAPNRIVRTAHSSGMGTSRITDDLIAYHEARAKGGCGLSILEACSVHPSSFLTPLALFNDSIVEDYRRLMARIRPHGMKVFQQLWHGGNLYNGYDGGAPWAVSSVAGFLGKVGRTMDDAMVRELIDAYAQAAVRAREGGLEGVEVHAAHGYLPQQFLTTVYESEGRTFESFRARQFFNDLAKTRLWPQFSGQAALGPRIPTRRQHASREPVGMVAGLQVSVWAAGATTITS
jgi:2,4-dienoyl-CoA reductase-like NADH-dependent reductase (Old Yellow Enzyme family)